MKTIIIIVSIVSACVNSHRTSNCFKIGTGRMFICVFTDLALGGMGVYRFVFFGTVFILPPRL